MRTAIYAGTFDPMTYGHRSVIERASSMFDTLIVVVAENPAKSPLLSVDERKAVIARECAPWPNVRVASTPGWVVHFAERQGARFLVRGVRGATDVEAEITLAHLNAEAAPSIHTIFVPATARLSQVSSSRLKELIARGEDVTRYCSDETRVLVQARLEAARVNQDVQHGV